MKYKHTNKLSCATTLYDSAGNHYVVLPNESVVLDINREWKGIIDVEVIHEKTNKKIRGDD
jgi:hypothetical protein